MGTEVPDRALLRKITPSLVTLLASEPEIQYVALRNINVIVQKYPDLLANEVKVRTQPGTFSFATFLSTDAAQV